MSDFWPAPKQRLNRMLEASQYRTAPHQGYDEIMLDPRVPKDDTPWWLQNTLNMPANAVGILSNAVADTANTGRAFLDPSVAPDPAMPTASGDQQLATAGILGVGNAGLATMPAAMMMRGGGQALGALASQNRQASPFAVLPAAEPRRLAPILRDDALAERRDHIIANRLFQERPMAKSFLGGHRDSPNGSDGLHRRSDVMLHAPTGLRDYKTGKVDPVVDEGSFSSTTFSEVVPRIVPGNENVKGPFRMFSDAKPAVPTALLNAAADWRAPEPTSVKVYHGTPDARYLDQGQRMRPSRGVDSYSHVLGDEAVYFSKQRDHANEYASRDEAGYEGRGEYVAPAVIPGIATGRFADYENLPFDLRGYGSNEIKAALQSRGADGLILGDEVAVWSPGTVNDLSGRKLYSTPVSGILATEQY